MATRLALIPNLAWFCRLARSPQAAGLPPQSNPCPRTQPCPTPPPRPPATPPLQDDGLSGIGKALSYDVHTPLIQKTPLAHTTLGEKLS